MKLQEGNVFRGVCLSTGGVHPEEGFHPEGRFYSGRFHPEERGSVQGMGYIHGCHEVGCHGRGFHERGTIKGVL